MATREHNLTKHWQAIDAAHHIHPFSDTAALNKEGVRVITHADGVYIYDSNGEKILDGMAGLWCVQIGYGNAALAEAGYEALKTLPYYNHFFKTTNPYTAELANKLAGLLPEGHSRVLFASSGSEANDSALKLIRYYWNLKRKPHKKIHLSRDKAYHGVTMAAASLSGLTPMHPQFDLPLPGFEKVATPYWFGALAEHGDVSAEEIGLLAAKSLEDKILELGAENVASFSAEPVHGAGGVIFPPDGYWAEINRICKKYDVLLHADEVITGFGRTGEWFGSQTYGIKPDIITMAKGLSSGYQPISAISLGERMGAAIANANEELVHGYTYSGHPVASAVALKNLEVMETTKLVARTKDDAGPYLQKRLRETFKDHPIVGEVRGVGLIAAVELVPDAKKRVFFPKVGDAGTHCRNYCFNSGLISRAIRDTMVLAPPLTISRDEIDLAIARLKAAIDNTARDFKKM